MNKRQLEVIKSQMRDEERALKELKQVYNKALKDVEANIQVLRGRTDFENIQSIIYQTQYQEAIKAQIEARLDILNSQQFGKMSDYLSHCYESGFVGSMYDLHGQGIPIIAAIDESDVIRALQTDSKISGNLYTKLGVDTKELKDSIRANLSRGFSAGADWDVIARNLDTRMQIGFNRAARIVRTEGHRVRCEASFHAQQVAKSKGADVMKQWDATLDGRTRPNHRLLDGKIVEVDEPFEIDGNEAMYPGEFGVAREDVNCRCQALQRAKWALDEDELQTLKDRAEFYGLDKSDDFDDFRAKYLPAAKAEAEKEKTVGKANPITLDDFPLEMRNTAAKKKRTQQFIDYLNGVESADSDVIELYRMMGDLHSASMKGIDFDISYTADGHAVARWTNWQGKVVKTRVKVPKLTGDILDGQIETTAHEFGHVLDMYLADNPAKMKSGTMPRISKIFATRDETIGDEAKGLFASYHTQWKQIQDDVSARYKVLRTEQADLWQAKKISWSQYQKEYKRLIREEETERDYLSRNAAHGLNGLEDIYDALSWGRARDSGVVKYGHGSKYYRDAASRAEETFANFCALSVTHPELIEVLERDKPEVVAAFREMVKTVVGR